MNQQASNEVRYYVHNDALVSTLQTENARLRAEIARLSTELAYVQDVVLSNVEGPPLVLTSGKLTSEPRCSEFAFCHKCGQVHWLNEPCPKKGATE